MGQLWNAIIIKPFSWLLLQFYYFTGSYGLALVLFAVVAKLILLPFSIKGKKSMMQMSRLNPKLQQLQKQYGKDRMRYNEEMQKLYKQENVSPLGGCLWSLLPLPVMIALYTVIRKPLTNLMNLAAEKIELVRTMLTDMGITLVSNQSYEELEMARYISDHFAAFRAKIPELIDIQFNFLGIDLSQIPQINIFKYGSFTWAFIGLFLIPFISGATAFFSARIGMKTNATSTSTGNAIADRTSKQMLYTMPLISVWIGFVMPAGLGIYWIVNNLLTILQEYFVGRRLKAKFEADEAKRAELERLEAEEEKRRRAEAIAQKALAAKTKGGKKQAQQKKSKPAAEPTTDRGRVDNRPYARGRAYDPNRFADERNEKLLAAELSMEQDAQIVREAEAMPAPGTETGEPAVTKTVLSLPEEDGGEDIEAAGEEEEAEYEEEFAGEAADESDEESEEGSDEEDK